MPRLPQGIRPPSLWLDADAGVSKSLTAVTSWLSRYGGWPAAPSIVPQRPSSGDLNGKAAVLFDGVDDALFLGQNRLVSGAPGLTLLVVSSPAALASGSYRPFILGTSAGPTTTRLSYNRIVGSAGTAGAVQVAVRTQDGGAAEFATSPNSDPAAAIGLDAVVVDAGGGSVSIRRNGAASVAAAVVASSTGFSREASAGGCVGSNGGALVLNGGLHDLLLFPWALAGPELAFWEGLLMEGF